ncbi:hypothetical protein IJS77_02480 [bacterium]|nr:hypothetical protein [bacterium]
MFYVDIFLNVKPFNYSLKPTLYLKNGELAESKPDIFRTQIGQNGHSEKPILKLTEASQS